MRGTAPLFSLAGGVAVPIGDDRHQLSLSCWTDIFSVK
jgi:hypothetical protein